MAEDRIAALEHKLRQLTDRQEILDCIVRNSRGNDRFDAELVSSSFHDDGETEIGPEAMAGKQYGVHANEAHAAFSDANLHNLTMHSCEVDGDVAHAESYVIALFLDKGAKTGRILAGRYIDRLERRDGEWGIVLRRGTLEVVLEGEAGLPGGGALAGSGYLRGNRDRGDPAYERPLTCESGERW